MSATIVSFRGHTSAPPRAVFSRPDERPSAPAPLSREKARETLNELVAAQQANQKAAAVIRRAIAEIGEATHSILPYDARCAVLALEDLAETLTKAASDRSALEALVARDGAKAIGIGGSHVEG